VKKAIFIVGPTAVGKTDLAFKISKLLPSILISADSVQVYRGANIISGKDKTFPTQLLDIVDPTGQFSVRNFVQLVRPIVKKAHSEQKIPIIVGGIGFYVDALFGKIDTISIPPSKDLREKLEKLNVHMLQEKLKKLSPERFYRMNNSDVNNKRRLIRAIEVARSTGSGQAGSNLPETKAVFIPQEVLMIGLKTSTENLRKRIIARAEERIKMGALDEAKNLFENYEQLSSQLRKASGYKELFDYLKGKLTYDVAKQEWINSEVKTAKNQMTWFKKNKNIVWFDVGQPGFEERILMLIRHEFSS